MKHHETFVIRCDDIGARCGDVGGRCGNVCVWSSDVGDHAEVIRCDDIGAARCGDVGARAELPAISARSYRRYQRGVSGDIGDCGVGITPQMCNRVTNHEDMSTFSKPDSGWSLAWDHVRGNIDEPCGAIADFCGVIADPCGVIADPCGVVAIPEAIGARRLLCDSLNIIKHC